MSRPWKHPKTGIYWLRKRVPSAFVPLVGKRIVTRSLRTRDLEEAKRLHAIALVALDDEWKALRDAPVAEAPPAPKSLSDDEAHERAAWLFVSWLRQHRDHPSEQTFWPTELHARMWSSNALLEDALSLNGDARLEAIGEARRIRKLEEWCLDQADDQAAARNWTLDADNRLRLAKALASAMQRASLELERQAKGELSTVMPSGSNRNAPPPRSVDRSAEVESASLTGLMEGWWREAQATGRTLSTYESYRNTFKSFQTFLGHDDATKVTAQDIVRFKDHRLTTPSRRTGRTPSAKTVKDNDLTALKAVFGWAAMNLKVAIKPAAGITIKLGKAPRLRSKGFTDDEARALLSATLLYDAGAGPTSAAKRWVPWLCAFTGARVGEMAQLRKQDIKQQGGHWTIRITPEAHTIKDKDARHAVIHQQIVDLGFCEFVANASDGYLFLNPAADGAVRGRLRGLKNRLAEWARAIVTDRGVAPNHGWRHRFKTIGMEADVAPRILDAIDGHAPRSVGDTYGDVTIPTIAAAIAKFPPVILSKEDQNGEATASRDGTEI